MKRTLLFSLVMFVLVCAWMAVLPTSSHAQAQPVEEGTCDALQIVFVVDQSGSMSGLGGNPATDPQGLRFFAPARAVETLSSLRYQSYVTSTIQIALVNFGDQPSLVMPWTLLDPVDKESHRILQQELAGYFQPVEGQGNTNVLPALQTASSLFNQASPQTAGCPGRGIILITDGQPYTGDPNFSIGPYMQELTQYVNQYMSSPDHQLFVIGLDVSNSYWDEMKPHWDAVTGDPDRVIRAEDQAHLGSLVITIAEQLARSLRRTGTDFTILCATTGSIVVPPYIQELKLRLMKVAPGIHLDVLDASGTRVDTTRSDLSVTIEGYDEPIETLTVAHPQPGEWTIQTQLPQEEVDRCRIQMLSFNAVGQLDGTGTDTAPLQFQSLPLTLQVVDATGGPLPEYADPNYDLNITAGLSGPTATTPISFTEGTRYTYTGEAIPLEAGTLSIAVKAHSQYPDGTEYVVFDKPLGTIEVQPVRFILTQGITDTVAQSSSSPLAFSIVGPDSTPVQLDLPLSVTLALEHNGETVSLPASPNADGTTYTADFQPEEPGAYVLRYEATVEAPTGAISIGSGDLPIDVFPTTQVRVQIVTPSDGRFLGTDFLRRPKGLPLEIQLVDESGTALAPGQIGAANPMEPFNVRILDAQQEDRASGLAFVPTGKPGLFHLTENELGPGEYEIVIEPSTTLGKEYLWAEPSWSTRVTGFVDPRFYMLLGGTLVALLLVGARTAVFMRTLRHPLSGYIEVYRNEPTEDGLRRKRILKTTLPTRRNRAVIRSGSSAPSFLHRILPSSVSNSSNPIRRLIVSCPSEEDSKAGRAHVEVELTSGKKMPPIVLDPSDPPVSLPQALLIEKGPRKMPSHQFDELGSANQEAVFRE